MNGKNQNIVGNQYGCLTVQKLAYKKSRKLYYTCLCECGCEVDVRKDQLIRGITKSCGCLQKDIAEKTMTENMKKHGLSNHLPHNHIRTNKYNTTCGSFYKLTFVRSNNRTDYPQYFDSYHSSFYYFNKITFLKTTPFFFLAIEVHLAVISRFLCTFRFRYSVTH